MMWGYGDWPGGGWPMWFGGLSMLLFWAVVIGLTVWGVNRVSRPAAPPPADDPVDIARRRLARSEITVEQFEEIKKALQG